MALDQISAVTQSVYIPVMVDNILKSNPTFVYLARKTRKLDGGATIRQPVALSKNSTVTSYSGADPLTLIFDEEGSAAEFNWSQYGVLIPITGLDDLRNSGGRAILNLIRMKLEMAEASLRESMGTDLQSDGTGNGNKNIIGLAAAIDDGTNVSTYGNISRTLFTNWKAQYNANGAVGRAFTTKLMNSAFESASKDNDRPNLIITTHNIYQVYMNLVQPNQRTMDSSMWDLGFPNLMYHGRPVVVDEQVQISPVHKMWFLNTKYIDMYVAKERNFRFIPFQQLPQQDVAVAKILWAGQVVCSQPRLQCQLTDLDSTL